LNALVAAAIVSISLNPLLYPLAGPTERWLSRRPRLWCWLTARAPRPVPTALASDAKPQAADLPQYRAVVVGYGPVGRTLLRLLRENGIEPTVIEMNLETVSRLRGEGVPAVYGDAAAHDTLQAAGVRHAATLILSASGMTTAPEIIRLARELN